MPDILKLNVELAKLYFSMNCRIHPNRFFLYSHIRLDGADAFKRLTPRMEATHVMEVAQLLLSLVHSWGIDLNLDKICETQLGLLRPMVRWSPMHTFANDINSTLFPHTHLENTL